MHIRASYDYVVIGAGSAGSVMADRLSRLPGATVLVVEAGPLDDKPAIHSPVDWLELLGSDADGKYATTPQDHAFGRSVPWPRGRVVGGSSSINALVFMRGAASDFDGWADQTGDSGWGNEAVLPAFQELETFHGGDARYRGESGPLSVELPAEHNPFSEDVYTAALGLGVPENPDFNAASLSGVGWNQLTVREGRRHSAADAFLHPAVARGNVTLMTEATVTRIVIEGGRATAVELDCGAGLERVGVDSEVLLAGGTLESPKLLMLSGVGPAETLRRWEIEVQVDLEQVGKNLHDHPGVPVTYHSDRTIPFGPNQHSEVGLFVPVDGDDLAVQFGVLTVPVDPTGVDPARAFSFSPSWTHPESRGSLTLRSASPFDQPLSDPAYLSAQRDVDGLVEAIRICREIAHQPALRAWGLRETSAIAHATDEASLRDYVRSNVSTWFHPVGTCRMGLDADSVVDTELRVRGVENLRVVDASVMPTVTTANTNAPTLMIAWRAADFIVGTR